MADNFNDMMLRIKTNKLRTELNKMPRIVKDLGVAFFKSRFRAQGWLDESFTPWPKRKKTDKRRPGRGILMDRGRLRNSIRGTVNGTDIVFGSDVPYAKIHNEGGTIQHPAREGIIAHRRFKTGSKAGRVQFSRNNKSASFAKKVKFSNYQTQIPKRQFMGDSAHLRRIVRRKIETTIVKVFS